MKNERLHGISEEKNASDSRQTQDKDKEQTVYTSSDGDKETHELFNIDILEERGDIPGIANTSTVPANEVDQTDSNPEKGEDERIFGITEKSDDESDISDSEISFEREGDLTFTNTEIPNEREDDLLYFAFMKHGLPLFEMDFYVEGMKYDPTLLAGFISAVSTFSKELSDRGLERIDQGNLKVGFVESDRVSLFYLAGSISDELEAKLKLLFTHFESRYYQFLSDDFICDESLFIDFRPYVLRTLTQSTVKRHYIPIMIVPKSKAILKFSTSIDIIDLIDGRKTVTEIAMCVGLDTAEISETLGLMKIEGLIDFEIDVSSHDVFIITPMGFRKIFSTSDQRKQLLSLFGTDVFQIIKSVDGTKSVVQIAKENEVNVSKVQQILSIVLTQEYIAHVPERIKAILVIDCLFKNLYLNLSKHISKTTAYEIIFKNLIESESILLNSVRFNNGSMDFKLCYDYLLTEENIESFEIYEEFMDPLLTIFDVLGDIDSDTDLRLGAFDEANNLFGVIF
ncbi:MAG: hypothetical protein ACTSQF_06575 [Candidatus Heimdallarchaeaceae archaeon]